MAGATSQGKTAYSMHFRAKKEMKKKQQRKGTHGTQREASLLLSLTHVTRSLSISMSSSAALVMGRQETAKNALRFSKLQDS